MNATTQAPPGPALLIDSATGVDVRVPIAGPGARAYAFVIDWHIRLVLALAWYVSGAAVYNRGPQLTPPGQADTLWLGAILAPALVIYFLYHPVLETATRGRTPGKRMAGVRIAGRGGGAPTVGQSLIRNVFRLVDSLPALYGIGLVSTLVTRDQVRVGDLAAGTLLVYEHTGLPEPPGRPAPGLRPEQAELAAELLARWPQLEAGARARLARALLAACGVTVGESASPSDPERLLEQLRQLLA